MIVAKFGGTSVADAAAITRVIDIIAPRRAEQPIVVVSALGGATNHLLAIAHTAVDGELLTSLELVGQLRDRHVREAQALLGTGTEAEELIGEIGSAFDELAHLAEAFRTLGFLTPRSLDAVAAVGELLSSQLVAAAFRQRGLPATYVDARDVMVTNDVFTKAEPDQAGITVRAQERLLPLIAEGRIPVIGGFVGAAPGRITTTLGRGGSDYSASLLGAAVGARAIEIWTDVDGMLTSDPRMIPKARLIERISFEEAAELASFGAKVLHPATIAPAVERGIPVYVFNSRQPGGPGTAITFDAPRLPVRAIAAKRATTLVKLRSSRMLLAQGFLRRVFEVFERHRTSVDVVTTSEVSVSVTLDETHQLAAIQQDLSALGEVEVASPCGVLAIVGAGLADRPDALAQALAALGPVPVHMASLSATGINFTLVVPDAEVVPAMQRLHAAFFEGAP